MITSRPDESDEMKAKDIYFDRYVEIIGFSEPQVKEYIGKYFKNNDRMKNIVMDHITKNVNLVSFAHIPVLCFLMCSYFEYTLQQPKKNNPLPVKTSDLYDEVVTLCQALQTPTCKVTNLHLGCNHITDASVASLC